MKSKNRLIGVVMILAGFFFMTTGGLVAEEMEMPEFIELDQDLYGADRKGPVPFEHEVHTEFFEVACEECHHVYEEGENVWEEGDPVQKCSACHDPLESEGEVKNLRLVFHRNCKGCHMQLKKEGISEDAPYRRCSGCHQRQS